MRQKSRRFFTESSHTWRPIVALTPTSGRGCKPTVELSSTGTESLSSSSLVFSTSCYTTDSWRPHRCCPLRKRLRTSTMGTWEGHRKHYIRYRKCPFPLKGSGPPRNTFIGPRAVAPPSPGFCNRGEVRYGSIGGLEYEVPQSPSPSPWRRHWPRVHISANGINSGSYVSLHFAGLTFVTNRHTDQQANHATRYLFCDCFCPSTIRNCLN